MITMKRLAFALLLVACDKEKPAPPPPPVASAAASVVLTDAGGPPAKAEKLEKLEMEEIRIRENVATPVKMKWIAPQGTAINDDAPFHVRWNRSDGLAQAPPDATSTGSAVKEGYEIKVQPLPNTPNATLTGEIRIVVCDSVNHSICLPVRRRVELGFTVVKDAPPEIWVQVPLPAAK